MMRAMRSLVFIRRAAALLLVAAAAGCSSAGTSPQGAYSTTEAFANQITAAFCSWQFRCCSAIEIVGLGNGRYTTEATCASSGVALSVADQLALTGNAIQYGLLAIDPAVASTCLDAYKTRPCNPTSNRFGGQVEVPIAPDVSAIVAACPGLVVGLVPVGERCDMTGECVAGARCVVSSATNTKTNAAAPGILTPLTPLGVCEPYRREGESCNASADCDPTASLYCDPAAGVCAKPAGPGDACGMGTVCDPTQHLFCDDNTTFTCVRFPQAGETCGGNAICDPDPTLELQCTGFGFMGGTCLPPGGENDACGGSALAPCRSGLACNPTQPDGIGVCGAAPADGSPCATGGVCGGQSACTRAGVCAPLGTAPTGAVCTSDSDCASLACGYGVPGMKSTCSSPRDFVVCAGNQTSSGNGSTGGGGSFDGGVVDAARPPPPSTDAAVSPPADAAGGTPPNPTGTPVDGAAS
jgi:hypothetical protein